MLSRDVVEVLLRNDALTNVADSKGCYPLHLAAWKGDAQIVRLLIQQGPSHTRVNEQVGRVRVSSLCTPWPHALRVPLLPRHDPPSLIRRSGGPCSGGCILFVCFLFSRQSFSVQPWLSWNLLLDQAGLEPNRSTCLCLPSAEIKGMCHLVQQEDTFLCS